MATTTANIKVGAATISWSAYVTAGGAGTFTDWGHHKGCSLTIGHEVYNVTSERSYGILKQFPQDMSVLLKLQLTETTLKTHQQATRQPDASHTGTTPNFVLALNQGVEIYYQLKAVVPGLGTNSLRTIILWRCCIEDIGDITYAKGGEQIIPMTWRAMFDDSVSTPQFGTITDS